MFGKGNTKARRNGKMSESLIKQVALKMSESLITRIIDNEIVKGNL